MWETVIDTKLYRSFVFYSTILYQASCDSRRQQLIVRKLLLVKIAVLKTKNLAKESVNEVEKFIQTETAQLYICENAKNPAKLIF